MPKPGVDDGVPVFRRWLVAKLKESRWPETPADTIESVARRLWVHPDALRCAQEELNRERKENGLALVSLGTGSMSYTHVRRHFGVAMPKIVFDDWKAYCALRRLPDSVVLRSIIQALLLGDDDPPQAKCRGWFYRGERHVMQDRGEYKAKNKRWPYWAYTNITIGAHHALQRRAMAANRKVMELVRAQIVEVLEGRVQVRTTVTTIAQMFDDSRRYVIPGE